MKLCLESGDLALDIVVFKCAGKETIVRIVDDRLICAIEKELGWDGQIEFKVGSVGVGKIRSYVIGERAFKAVLDGGLIFEAGCRK